MKKNLFILLLFPLLVFSQPYLAPSGATWHYPVWSGLLGVNGMMEFKYTNTVTINNVVCKQITGTFTGTNFMALGSSNFTVIPNLVHYITYENNGVVYLFNGSTFDTLANFNAQAGDTWRDITTCTSGCANARGYYVVTSTGSVTINNVSLKQINVNHVRNVTILTQTVMVINTVPTSTMIPVTSSTTTPEQFTERFISSGGASNCSYYPVLFKGTCDWDHSSIFESPFVNFKCYQDDTFPLYKPYNNSDPSDCSSILGITNPVNHEYKFSIYPSMTQELIHINFESGTGKHELKIYNMNGSIVKSLFVTGETEISVKDLPGGLYLVQLIKDGQVRGYEKMIVTY